MVLVLGGPRSGTSWLAKIFDSHPAVLYRHEPDTVERFPYAAHPEQASLAEAARYLRRLAGVRTLKPAGSLPVFPKAYTTGPVAALRRSAIYGLRALDGIPGLRPTLRAIPIPDGIDRRRAQDLTVVIKSVSARQTAGLFARAMPDAKIVFILRDPYGQTASMMRGTELGKFAEAPVGELLSTPVAAQYGLTAERLHAMEPVERHAWHWVVMNETAIQGLRAAGSGTVLRYQDLCSDPERTANQLFGYAGLSWHRQTAEFLRRSTRSAGPDRYYAIHRDPTASLNKWRAQLSAREQSLISAVVRQTEMAPFCADIAAAPAPAPLDLVG